MSADLSAKALASAGASAKAGTLGQAPYFVSLHKYSIIEKPGTREIKIKEAASSGVKFPNWRPLCTLRSVMVAGDARLRLGALR